MKATSSRDDDDESAAAASLLLELFLCVMMMEHKEGLMAPSRHFFKAVLEELLIFKLKI